MGITKCVIFVVGRVIFWVGRPDRGLLEASWSRNGRFVEAFWGFFRVSGGPGELCMIAKHTAGTVVLVRNGDRAPGYTWIVNNVCSDGPKLGIERGRSGICCLQTTYALTDRE